MIIGFRTHEKLCFLGSTHSYTFDRICETDFAANLDSRKSKSGCTFCLFVTAVIWKSTLQHVVALSTTEAEYMSLTEAIKEAVWMRDILAEFGISQCAVEVKGDSRSATLSEETSVSRKDKTH